MPRFFVKSQSDITKENIFLYDEDAEHLSLSLRARVGESITAGSGDGTDYLCKIEAIERRRVVLKVLSAELSRGESRADITLYQALCKGDKMDSIVKKSVELGVNTIVPFVSGRCVVRPGGDFAKKQQRYQKLALEAAKQCGRGKIPQVRECASLPELVKSLSGSEKTLLCYEKAAAALSSVSLLGVRRLSIIVGSEGGFEESEAEALVAAGAVSVSLGGRILRCETAPIAALAACLYAMGEM